MRRGRRVDQPGGSAAARGRAGRVRPGYVFKLFTKFRSQVHMAPARIPEMLRGPLQELCLQLRLAPILADVELRAAFGRCLATPPDVAVTAAISSLQRTGALEADESLTPLGRHLAALPCEVGVGRLIIFGALLKCAQPIMLIAAALSDRSPFYHRSAAATGACRPSDLPPRAVGPLRFPRRTAAGPTSGANAATARRASSATASSSRSARCRG